MVVRAPAPLVWLTKLSARMSALGRGVVVDQAQGVVGVMGVVMVAELGLSVSPLSNQRRSCGALLGLLLGRSVSLDRRPSRRQVVLVS